MSALIEGRRAVIEALRAGVPMTVVVCAEGSGGRPMDEIRRLAEARGVPIRVEPRRLLDERSVRGAHQGVLAEAMPYVYTELEEVLSRVGQRPASLIVALDHITDEGNLGAVARSIEVAGADALVIPKARSAAIGPVAHKASAGALSHLPVVRVPNIVRALERLKEAGYWIAGATAEAKVVAWDAPLDGRLVLVLGSEGRGLSRLVVEACDLHVRLPVAGAVDSLNVAQAATVLAFEWVRRTGGRE